MKYNQDNKIYSIIIFLLFLIFAYFPIFLHLDTFSIVEWDESLFALRAFKLSYSGDFLNNFSEFAGLGHHPNTKYPLITIVQAIFFKLMGYNELALRLPSALITLSLVLVIIYFFTKEIKDKTAGYFSAMVLLTSSGFVDLHITRTGSHDIFLVFFTIMILFTFYKFIHNGLSKKYLYQLAFLFILGFLTKGVMIFFIFPAFVIYAFIQKKIITILKMPVLYVCLGIVIAAITGYFLFREMQYPGFFKIYLEYEAIGRFNQYFDNHKQYFWFYLDKLYNNKFHFWISFLPFSLIFIISKKFKPYKNFLLLIWISTLLYFLIISVAKTKLIHYTATLYPLCSMLIGFSLSKLIRILNDHIEYKNKYKIYLVYILFIISIFNFPYKEVIKQNMQQSKHVGGTFFDKVLLKLKNKHKTFSVAPNGWNSSIAFYVNVLNKLYNYDITIKGAKEQFKYMPNEKVLVYNRIGFFKSRYKYDILLKNRNVYFIEIKSPISWVKINKTQSYECGQFKANYYINPNFSNDTLIKYYNGFEFKDKCKIPEHITSEIAHSGNYSSKIYNKNMYSVGFNNHIYKFPKKSTSIKVKSYVYKKGEIDNQAGLIIDINKKTQDNEWHNYKINQYIKQEEEWGLIDIELFIGEITEIEKIKVFFLNPNSNLIYLDDIEISVY